MVQVFMSSSAPMYHAMLWAYQYVMHACESREASEMRRTRLFVMACFAVFVRDSLFCTLI
jgi:hypothetical protein